MIQRIPFQWNTANFNWNATNPTDGKIYPPNEVVTGTNLWDDCALIVELIDFIKTGGRPEDYFGKEPEKKKKFIKLLCKIEGIEYKETKSRELTIIQNKIKKVCEFKQDKSRNFIFDKAEVQLQGITVLGKMPISI